jgi:uncharacterized repeat protein (TIGR03803 family)
MKVSVPAMRLPAVAMLLCVLAACNQPSSPPQNYSVGGTVSGLTQDGLTLALGDRILTIGGGASSFTFVAQVPGGASYTVTIAAQPTGETCTVANATGTIDGANVANVVVTCSGQAYALGGSVSGLTGNGLVLSNGTDSVAVPSGATSFTLPTPVAYSSSYTVSVTAEPGGQSCTVTNGAGTMPAAAVTSVAVSCTDQPFTVGGVIQGLGSNSGLVLANGSDSLAVSAGATTFTLPAAVPFGSPYAVTVTQSPPGLTCSLSNGTGTMGAANVTNLSVVCSNQSFTLGGTISGLSASGLVLVNGTDTLTVPSGATSFTMPTAVAYTAGYAIGVQTQPANEICTVSSGTATMPANDVSNVSVACSVTAYTIGGSISGLGANTGLVLADNGADSTTIAANATTFTMTTGIADGANYAITVSANPVGLVCRVAQGTGAVAGANVTNVAITCTTVTETTLYSFTNGADGGGPTGSLMQASNGLLYGYAMFGGSSGRGAIYSIDPSTNAVTAAYSFPGEPGGQTPSGTLLQGTDGNLYGTTQGGGSGQEAGALFSYNPTSGAVTILHAFSGGSDGQSPNGVLVQTSDGVIYGLTQFGGTSSEGTIFSYDPATGTYSLLYSFAGGTTDGASPMGGMVQGGDGNLYGTTLQGGANGGTLFEYSPSTQTEILVHSFAAAGDASVLTSTPVLLSDGRLYGTSAGGGAGGVGTIWVYDPSTQAESVLYGFGFSGGYWPNPFLTVGTDGLLYGLTNSGGGNNSAGVFYSFDPSTQVETVLHAFPQYANGNDSGPDGNTPSSNGVVQAGNGNFYGETNQGGTDGFGVIFETSEP